MVWILGVWAVLGVLTFINSAIYGKPVEVTESDIKDTLNLVEQIVEVYEQHGYSLKGTNISMDRYYISIPLTEWLYYIIITCIGTLNSNRKGLPKKIKETKGRE